MIYSSHRETFISTPNIAKFKNEKKKILSITMCFRQVKQRYMGQFGSKRVVRTGRM
jgi:hypothetical protein